MKSKSTLHPRPAPSLAPGDRRRLIRILALATAVASIVAVAFVFLLQPKKLTDGERTAMRDYEQIRAALAHDDLANAKAAAAPLTQRDFRLFSRPAIRHWFLRTAMTFWKSFRHRLEEWGCRALAWGLPRLSRKACVRLGNALGALAFVLDRRGRAVAFANLECALGDHCPPAQRARIARAAYRNFVRTMLDLFWAARLTPADFHRFMQVEGFDELRARLDREKRGAVFMCVHQGNWEWASLACGFLGFGNVVVAENFKNPRLTTIFSRLRQISGQTIVPQENSILRLLKIAKRGGATGMLIDLNLAPTQAATVIEGFGLKMCVPLLHAALAQRVGALLIPVETEPRADGTCRVIAYPAVEFPPDASLAEIAQRCWDAFEPIIRTRPELWLWAYKHFRYRPQNSNRSYPAYANESGKFEKLLESANTD